MSVHEMLTNAIASSLEFSRKKTEMRKKLVITELRELNSVLYSSLIRNSNKKQVDTYSSSPEYSTMLASILKASAEYFGTASKYDFEYFGITSVPIDFNCSTSDVEENTSSSLYISTTHPVYLKAATAIRNYIISQGYSFYYENSRKQQDASYANTVVFYILGWLEYRVTSPYVSELRSYTPTLERKPSIRGKTAAYAIAA